MKSGIDGLIQEARLRQDEVGAAVGVTGSAVSNKIAGRRPWLQGEITKLLALLSARLGRVVTYEEAFGEPAPVEPAAPQVES